MINNYLLINYYPKFLLIEIGIIMVFLKKESLRNNMEDEKLYEENEWQKKVFAPLRFQQEFNELLTKLSEILFVLEGRYETLDRERNLIHKYCYASEISNFLLKTAMQIKEIHPEGCDIANSLSNWDALGTQEVLHDIENWLIWYISNVLPESRMNKVKEFISREDLRGELYKRLLYNN